MKTVQQIIDDTLKAENHDERYLCGRFKGFYRGFPMDMQLLTCEDFSEAAGCCDTCHTFYIVYEMDLVETPRAGHGCAAAFAARYSRGITAKSR
jgi:hypothetical protein